MATTTAATRPRLKERYDRQVRAELKETLGLGNIMEVPRLDKIVINMGVGRATQQKSLIEGAMRDLEIIAGQKPVVTRAKKSIASFKLREGQEIGAKVTLRGDRAWEFLDRLLAMAIPRIRDFRGLVAPILRRPRQLHVRGHRAADLPRNRLRPHRHHQRHGHHHCHHRTHQRRGPGTPGRLRLPVPTGEPVTPWRRRP